MRKETERPAEPLTTPLAVPDGKLSASEARLRGIFEAALDAIVTTDAESVITDWNHRAETLFGWSAEEAVGRTLNETIIPVRYREAHDQGVRHYLATGEGPILSRRIEISALDRNGREFPVELTVAPVWCEGRMMFTSFIRDITERVQAERQLAAQYAVTRVLAESESLQEALPRALQSIGEALDWDMGVFWSVDSRTDQLRCTHIWTAPSVQGREFEAISEEMVFAPGAGLPGRVWESGRPAWIRDVTQDPDFPRHAVASHVGVHAAFALPVRVSGEFMGVMEFFQRPVAEPDAALFAAMEAMGSDIGQFIRRKQAEEQLREREETNRFFARVSAELAASTPDYEATLKNLARLAVPTLADYCAVYLANEDGSISLLGTSHADPAKKPLAQKLAHYPIDPRGAHPAIRVQETGEPLLLPEVSDALIERVAQDRSHLRLLQALGIRSAIMVPLTARGARLGTVTLIAAESERRFEEADLAIALEFARRAALAVDNARLYHDAQEANRVKADFLATMSHELRTPLNASLGYLDLLRTGLGGPLPEKAERYLERIDLSARHLLQLIEEVLAFARLEAGRETVVLEPVSLSDLVAEVTAVIEPLAAAKNLRFRADAPEARAELRTDPRKLRQILLNLLGNAVKFTAAGTVEFAARAENGEVLFRVRDTGVGIAAKHTQDIFNPFWQVEQGTTRVAGGTGLGLSISERYVRLLGGSIEVQSAPGEGSTFTVRLPCAPGSSPDDNLLAAQEA